jgi:hypothetical protein
LGESLQKAEQQLAKTKESLVHSEEMTNSIEEKYKKMMAGNEEALRDKIRLL